MSNDSLQHRVGRHHKLLETKVKTRNDEVKDEIVS